MAARAETVVMSASIYWEPAKRDKTRVAGQSTVAGQIEKLFGAFPLRLGRAAGERARALSAGGGGCSECVHHINPISAWSAPAALIA